MSQGKVSDAITHRRVLAIAVPILFSNVTVPLLGAVDTAVVGQIGEAAPIGAVGVGAIAITAIYWIFGFLRMGTSGLVAQARGAGDVAETGALLMRGMLIAGCGGLFLIAVQIPLVWAIFQVAPASGEVETLARDYFGIRIWGAPGAIAIYALTGWLIAMERTRGVLVLQLWMNGLNIVLDLVFVLGFDWGVNGVALATIIAEWSGALVGIWLCRSAFSGNQWRDWPRVLDRAKLHRMAAVNGDIMIRSILLEAAFVSFLFQGAAFGDVTLAANQIVVQFLHIIAYAMDGFAFAAEALVGAALGARQRETLRRAAFLTSAWGLGIVAAMSLGFALFGTQIIAIMTTAGDVRIEAAGYLWWIVLMPILGVPAWMLDGIFIGATRTRDMRNGMLISFAAYVVAVLALVPVLGNHGLWCALLVLNLVRGLTLWRRYPALEASAD